jgi:hypothetical protein
MGARFGEQDRCEDERTHHGDCRGIAQALDRGRTSLTAFATVARVTAARSRSVWYAPPTGWVTVLAGLLARGSAPGRPAFPVSQWLSWTTDSPLTVAGAATLAAFDDRSVFPLASPVRTEEPTHGQHSPWLYGRQDERKENVHAWLPRHSQPQPWLDSARPRSNDASIRKSREDCI